MQVNESITATVTVDKVSGSRVKFMTQCHSTVGGKLLVDGMALALLKPAA